MSSSYAELLRSLSSDLWFQTLDPHVQEHMISRASRMNLGVGEYVARKGDEPNGLLALISGVLKVSTLRENGKEAILTILEPGNWFGEASMVDGLPRWHDISVIEPAEVLVVQRDTFDELMNVNGFARAISMLQAIHARTTYNILEDAILLSPRARIARRLLRLSQGDWVAGVSQRHLVPVTQYTLARMLGIARQTLALELKAMAAEGAITIGYGNVEIKSEEMLMKMDSEC